MEIYFITKVIHVCRKAKLFEMSHASAIPCRIGLGRGNRFENPNLESLPHFVDSRVSEFPRRAFTKCDVQLMNSEIRVDVRDRRIG